MSPELVKNINKKNKEILDFNAEKSDIFSFGISILCIANLIEQKNLLIINNEKKREKIIEEKIQEIKSEDLREIIRKMTIFDIKKRIGM